MHRGTWGAPNWYCELGGDNKLKVSAINISETFRYSILKDLTASVTAGYNTSTAIRDKQSKAIDWYNYAGDRVVRSNPTEDKSSYSKSNSRTDFLLIVRTHRLVAYLCRCSRCKSDGGVAI